MNGTLSEPILGARIIEHIEIDALLPFLNRKALYRISWGAQKARGEKWEKIQKEYDQRLESMLQALQTSAWLAPAAGFGHWQANSEGNTILLYDPLHSEKVIARFSLPRQSQGEQLCLADYLRFLELDAYTFSLRPDIQKLPLDLQRGMFRSHVESLLKQQETEQW